MFKSYEIEKRQEIKFWHLINSIITLFHEDNICTKYKQE